MSVTFFAVRAAGFLAVVFCDLEDFFEFEVSGDKLQYVTIPVGYQHSINNIGDDELILILWANELFDPEKSDTYTMEV